MSLNRLFLPDMYEEILNLLPYKSSFRFVDSIHRLDENGVTGDYTLRKDAWFYEDHFAGNPVTPGVIIIEIMAQIGLVVLGIFLMKDNVSNTHEPVFPLFTSTEVNFFKMVLPGEKVTVQSEKVYFRFGKLKCTITLLDAHNRPIAKGSFAGIIKKAGDGK